MDPEENCPIHPIDIPENREIVYTDEIIFPWKQDPKGYFLVKIEGEFICCGIVNNEHKMLLELKGKDPNKLIKEIIKRDLCDKDHVGYIASELIIAHFSIKNNRKYVQR